MSFGAMPEWTGGACGDHERERKRLPRVVEGERVKFPAYDVVKLLFPRDPFNIWILAGLSEVSGADDHFDGFSRRLHAQDEDLFDWLITDGDAARRRGLSVNENVAPMSLRFLNSVLETSNSLG